MAPFGANCLEIILNRHHQKHPDQRQRAKVANAGKQHLEHSTQASMQLLLFDYTLQIQ